MIDLKNIKSPADLKGKSLSELEELAESLRTVLLRKLSVHGGHTGPNLGFLEATVALHYVFNSPVDKIVYDVSHQSYVHKMLTGRIDAFIDPTKYDTVTGYTNPGESEHDFFTIGHTSTAVSLAGGLAVARDMKGETANIIAVVGDGSLGGGEAFEGLDTGATLKSNFIIVVNDNDMSIAENHGSMYDNLRLLRETDGKAADNFFKTLGYDYLYVPYGNDLKSLIAAFERVKDTDRPVVVHLNTQKGKGFAPAEANREMFHYAAPFNLETGAMSGSDAEGYDDIFSNFMLARMQANKLVAVITAGTPGVLGFTPQKRHQAGSQFIDVGIAEQEAVALASGMAKGGCRPVFGVVSSFIQRAYDQLSQDVAINGNPVVLNIFYGGINGMTDVTHLGWFDIALISKIPGWVYLAPTCKEEYVSMLDWAIKQTSHPVAVRVPGIMASSKREFPADYSELNKSEVVTNGSDVAVIAAGTCLQVAMEAADTLRAQGKNITVVNPRYLSGLDVELLDSLKDNHQLVITMEDAVLDGGFGEKVARYYGDSDMKVKCCGVKKEFLDRYNVSEVMVASGLTADSIVALINS